MKSAYVFDKKMYVLMMAVSTKNLGMSSRMDDILKNQLRHVSLADSGTWSGLKSS